MWLEQQQAGLVIPISNNQKQSYALLAVTLRGNFHYDSAQFLPGVFLSGPITNELTVTQVVWCFKNG